MGDKYGRQVPQPQRYEEEVKEDGQEVSQPVLRQSTRVSRPPNHYVPSLDYVMVTDYKKPSYYKEAMLREDKLKWEKAMQSEMDLLLRNPHGSWLDYHPGRDLFHASGSTN